MIIIRKTKLLLTLLTILIAVLPLTVQVIAYQDNLLGLIIPPEIADLINGNNNIINTQFQAPQIVGDPQYNPETKTATFTFTFTNPLTTEMNINTLEAGVKCHDHDLLLGTVSIPESITLTPGETAQIQALGQLSDEAINHFLTQHASTNNVNIDFVNLNVNVAGIQVQVDEQNIGYITIPQEFFR